MLRPATGIHHPPKQAEAESASPIPLLFLVTNFDRGGAEKILTRWAIGLPRAKYAIQVAALQARSHATASDLIQAGIPAWDLGMVWKGDLRAPFRLRQLLRRGRFQILVTLLFHPTVLGRLVGGLCGVPVRISSERIMEWEGVGRRLVNRWTAGLATHVIAVSDRVATYAAREFQIPPERLSTIPNGVDLDHYRPTGRPQEAGTCVIGCTARLHRKNDHPTLLRAFAAVSQRRPEARLLLVGRGPEEANLRACASSLGVAARVQFVGEQEDVVPYLHRMDVYVQSSVAEGMPNSVLEAMACGLPVVATSVGGTTEVVLDGETGRLVPPGDPAAMADAMLKLLEEGRLAKAWGRAGRARVESHFGEGLMLQRMEELLDRLVKGRLGLTFQPSVGWVRC